MNLGNAKENKLFVINSDKKYFATADDINPNDKNSSLSYIIKAISENSIVLDVGCSYGYLGEWLNKNKNCQVYGVDIDKEAVGYVKERGYYKDVFNLDLDYPGKTKDEFDRFRNLTEIFDFVICADVLEHLKQPTEALEFIVSKLKLGGQALISIPNIAHMDIILNLLVSKFNYSELGILDNTHLRFFTKKSFVEWINSANELYKDKGFKLDVRYLGGTKYISEFLDNIKNEYSELYNMILNNNQDLEILQNIFALTKVNNFANAYGLEDLITSINYPDVFQIISGEIDSKKKEIENLNLEMVTLKEKYDKEIKNREQVIENLTKEKDAEIENLQLALSNKELYIKDIENKYNEINNQLAHIYNSHGWRFLLRYYKIRDAILPEDMNIKTRLARKVISFLLFPFTIRRNYKIRRDLNLICNSNLFDQDWYLERNPDVSQNEIEPAHHYLLYGGFEGRDPSPHFSSKWYLETYRDVQQAGMNPLVHYLKYGKKEGRLAKHEEMTFWNDNLEVGDMNSQNRIVYYINRFLAVWRQEGTRSVWNKALHKIRMVNELTSNEDEEVHFKVSIIIPVYNALSMTKACLHSIYNETRDLKFEVIIVDNASDDGTSKWLMEEKNKYSNLKIFRLDRNIGFGPAVNFGIQRSKGEFVVILNNDTLVSPGWLDNLLAVVKVDPSVGIVSPVTNYVGEGPQIDAQAQNLPPDPVEIAQYAKSIANRTDVCYEPNRLVFFCVLIRRELIDLIGYLDEGYEKGNFEDDDYCLRARMAGYRLAIAKNSFVYHHGSATFKANRIFHNKWMQVNRGRFYRKAGRISVSSLPRLSSPSKREKTVSVILRTKDRPKLLLNALNSLKNQTYRDFDVVLVNDGGEDVSSLVAFFEVYFPIKYVCHDVSRGRTAAINTGLQNANGKWIAYLDDDDIFYPWHLETLLQAAENNSAKVIYSDYNRALFENCDSLFPIRLIGAPPWDYNRQELLIQNYLPIHSYIHLRECVDKVGLWNESLDRLEDYEFLLRLSASFDFYHVKKVTCEYRYYLDNESSITSQGREVYLTALQKIYRKFPVDTPDLVHARQMVEDAMRKQINQIAEIMKNSQGTNVNDIDVRRKIIQLVVGM